MGLKDAQLSLSDSQNLAQLAGTYQSTNVIDLGVPGTDVNGNIASHDAGQSELAIDARVVETFTSAGAATVQLQVVGYDDAARTLNRTVYVESDLIAKATLVKGYRFTVGRLPPGMKQEFLCIEYVIGTATTTAGKISADLVLNPS